MAEPNRHASGCVEGSAVDFMKKYLLLILLALGLELIEIDTLAPIVPRLPLATPRPQHPDPHRPLQCSLNGLGLAVREILGEVGFRELMQRGAKGGVFHLETR